jgi:hypothetical protein
MTNSLRFTSVRAWAAAISLAAIAAGSAAASPVTFARYFQSNGTQQQWTISANSTTTSVSAAGSVLMLFSGIAGLPFSGPQAADFTLTAASDQLGNCGVSCGPGDSFVQPGFTGSFSFIASGGPNAGANLLSGIFQVTGSPSTTGAQFSSSVGSSGGSFDASATAGNLNQLIFTSDYFSFLNQDTENASWSLSSLIPNFATGPVTGNQARPSGSTSFHAAGSGTFSSDPGPTVVPEPMSFALIGSSLCC